MKGIEHALIMAAGRGTRMLPLTKSIPKPMAPYQNTTLIANGIETIRKHINNIHITVGYKGPILAQHVIQHGVTSVFNTTGKDNAWWLYNTLMKFLNEPVIVLTCDNVIELEFEKLTKEYYDINQPACMLVPVKPIKGVEGDYLFHKRNIVTKVDRYQVSDCYCSGIQVVNPHKINSLTYKTDNFYNVWSQLIDHKELLISELYPKKWLAIDTLEQLKKVNGSKLMNI